MATVKTLYLAQRIPYPPNKGEKIRTFHQIKYLLENGHEIFLCSPYSSAEELELFGKFADNYGVHIEKAGLGAKAVRYLAGLFSHKPLSVANFYNKKLQHAVDRIVAEEGIQNIVCTSSSMAEYVFNCSTLPAGKHRPRLVMDFMDMDSDKWRQYGDSAAVPIKWIFKRESTLLAKYEQEVYRFFDASFFISRAEVDLFCQKNKCVDRPLAIGNGIDYQSYAPAALVPENRDPVFIFTGVMDYRPNVDAVIWFTKHVWPRVIRSHPESRFIIAGMNPAPAIMALAKGKGIEITGFVDDILPYYHQSDFFVAPLRIARGVQNKILQAFSCGLPVISTSMGAEGIEYIEGKHILIADTPDDFFNRIEMLVNDGELTRSLKDNAMQLVKEHYSWEAKLVDLLAILN